VRRLTGCSTTAHELVAAASTHRPRRRLHPQVLQAVELVRGGGEDVDNAVQVVQEDPAGLAGALRAPGQEALLVLEGLVDSVVDRLGLALAAAEQITKKSV